MPPMICHSRSGGVLLARSAGEVPAACTRSALGLSALLRRRGAAGHFARPMRLEGLHIYPSGLAAKKGIMARGLGGALEDQDGIGELWRLPSPLTRVR
jgi:hypothetical protein